MAKLKPVLGKIYHRKDYAFLYSVQKDTDGEWYYCLFINYTDASREDEFINAVREETGINHKWESFLTLDT